MRKWIAVIAATALVHPLLGQDRNSLKSAFKDAFYVGVALNADQFTGKDKAGVDLLADQFNSISPENALKWESIHPQPGRYDFALADSYVDFGWKHQMFVVGHTLVWHSQTPAWVFEDEHGGTISREALLERMRDHIFTVVGRYKGKIRSWDVVNEALNDDGTLRNSKWLQIIGPEYISLAYEWAHQADPDAELNYNDYDLENPSKLKGAQQIVRDLKSKGIPLSAVGMQGHDSLTWPSVEMEERAIHELSSMGVKVAISEMDINVLPDVPDSATADVAYHIAADPKLNPYAQGLPQEKQTELAHRYAELFAVFLKHRTEISRVTLWGLSDKDSWLNNWPVNGRTSYPLLFDRSLQPKMAYEDVLQEAKKSLRK